VTSGGGEGELLRLQLGWLRAVKVHGTAHTVP